MNGSSWLERVSKRTYRVQTSRLAPPPFPAQQDGEPTTARRSGRSRFATTASRRKLDRAG